MVRWLSIGVISYMILGIIWWGMLLFRKNQEIYDTKVSNSQSVENIASYEEDRSRQNTMIWGEGAVLVLSLLIGIYIINRSSKREIQSANQQSNFLLSVSHELKSPIAAIKLALQTLIRPDLPAEKESKFLHSAINDTNRLEKLVQNILLSANIEDKVLELYLSDIELSKLLRKLINQYHTEYPDQLIELQTKGQNFNLKADEQHLKQAIVNVIDNAIKYTVNNKPIMVELAENSHHIKIDISNQGIPIDIKDQVRIFEKFYRVKKSAIREKEGTGIGLYIAKEIVEAHRGYIDVKSNSGFNHFIINLPDDR